jgi:carbon monoxide dehydrogenase subunit G
MAMRKQRVGTQIFLVLLLMVGVVGCGKETVTVAPPSVVAVTPLSGATGVPVTQVVTATFNEAMNASSLTGATFTLTGAGGTAVAGNVSYAAGTFTASLTPSSHLAYNTVYTATITTAASDPLGDELSAAYTWSFTTATQPSVLSTVPTNGATAVPVNQVLSATFSKAMNCATLASPATSFTLTGPGSTAVAGIVSCSGSVATFTPSTPLAYNTVYTATISTIATDSTGDPLAANYTWTFTTAVHPTVLSTIPANGATAVPVNQVLSATFSTAMNCATLATPATSFSVSGPGATPVAGTVSCSGAVATFTPLAPLAGNTLYTATISTTATDSAGDPLAANYTWTFTTAVRPTVLSTVPANGATGVPLNQVLSATFSTAMNCATLASPATSFTLSGPGSTAVPGIVTCSGSVATFTPLAPLANNTLYTATISTTATDSTGDPLAGSYTWSFTTITPPPLVISTAPLNGATGVPLNQVVSATFNEAMNCASLTAPATSFVLTGPGTTAVAGTVACSGAVATFTPTAPLTVNTIYTATITTGAKSAAGTAMVANYVWLFRTLPAPTPPTVISTVPANLATGVPINQALRLRSTRQPLRSPALV